MRIDTIKVTSQEIENTLWQAGVRREPITVTLYDRAKGKTTALINFAKEFCFNVIVPFDYMRESLVHEHGYQNIYTVAELKMSTVPYRPIVFDEGVDYQTLEESKYEVVTGFIRE